MRKTFAAMLAMVALVPAVASAQPLGQDLAFETVYQASQSGHATAEQKVITNAADYAKWFNGQPPASPKVDFASEDVIAVAMGSQSSSGYGTSIVRIVKNTGVAGAVVHYTQTVKPTGVVLWVITTPVHVVKVKRSVTSYSFVNDSASAAAWDKLSSGTQNFQQYNQRVELAPNGAATLYQSSPTAKYAPLVGQATAAELKAVNDAFAKADVKTLPAAIKDNRVFIVAPTTEQLVSTVGGKDYTLDASLDYYPGYDARVKPLVDALNAIGARLKNPAPAPSFEKVMLAYVGGFIMFSDTFTVSKDGAVTVDRSFMHGGSSKLYTGQATKDELQKIKDAFAAADVTTLPDTINDPTPIMDIPSQRIASTVNGKDYTTTVTKAGRYMQYDARLAPLVDAIRAPGDRIVQEAEGESISGVVTTNASGAIWVDTYAVSGNNTALRALIAAQKGKIVTLQGHVKRIGAVAMVEPMWIQGWTTTNLNLRAGASYTAKILTTLGKSAGVQITGRSWDKAWFKVDAAGQSGWVRGYYVQIGQ